MKKVLIAVGLIIVYTALYIFSNKFDNWWWLGMLPFLVIPPLISILFFNKGKQSISFFLSGMFVFALLNIIGVDYSKLLNIDLNDFVGEFYAIFVGVLIIAGIVSGLVELVMFSIRKLKL